MSDVVKKHFWCDVCKQYWCTSDFMRGDELNDDDQEKSVDSRLNHPTSQQVVLQGPRHGNDDADDPFDYYCKCPKCGVLTRAVPHYYANIPKMRTCGPKTEEGKRRSALNGMKHGIYAQAHHLLAPANGKYDICQECDLLEDCRDKKIKYCPFKQDLMLRTIAAYENGDLEHLKTMAGLNQGKMMIVLDNCFDEIMQTGVLLKSLKVSNGRVVYNKKADPDHPSESIDDLDNPIFEYKANPLIDVVPKVMEVAGLSSNQQKMNPSKQEDVDDEKLKKGQVPEDGLMTFMTMMNNFMTLMSGGKLAETAKLSRDEDPVHKDIESQGEGEAVIAETGIKDNPFGGR